MAGERTPVHSRNKMSYNLVSYKVFLDAQFFQGGDHSQLEVLRILGWMKIHHKRRIYRRP